MTKMRFVFSKKKKKAIGFSPKTLENRTFDLNIKLYIYLIIRELQQCWRDIRT